MLMYRLTARVEIIFVSTLAVNNLQSLGRTNKEISFDKNIR